MDGLINRKQAISGLFSGRLQDDLIPLERPQNETGALVIARRAAAPLCPENSLAGIKVAARCGVDIVEVDVRRTLDGVPVLLHDRTMARTTGGVIPIHLLPARWVTTWRLLAASRSNVQTEERVPTLEAALEALPDGLVLGIHIKDRGALAAVLALLEQRGEVDRTWLWLDRVEDVDIARERLPKIRVTLPDDRRRVHDVGRYLEVAQEARATAVCLPWGRVTPEVTAEAHARELLVFALDHEVGTLAEKVKGGLGGVITDQPLRAAMMLEVIGRTGGGGWTS